jgi:hypothetical protein
MSTAVTMKESAGGLMPALIAGAGDSAARRFLEFFTVNIRNKNTRAACARAAELLRWCEAFAKRSPQEGSDAL